MVMRMELERRLGRDGPRQCERTMSIDGAAGAAECSTAESLALRATVSRSAMTLAMESLTEQAMDRCGGLGARMGQRGPRPQRAENNGSWAAGRTSLEQ